TSAATTTLSSRGTTRWEGRPERPPTAAVCSETSARLCSSPVSAPIVLRFSPSCFVSTARVVGPCVCTVWRMARRFARRSSSVPTPVGVGHLYAGAGGGGQLLLPSDWSAGCGLATAEGGDAGRHKQHQTGDDVLP